MEKNFLKTQEERCRKASPGTIVARMFERYDTSRRRTSRRGRPRKPAIPKGRFPRMKTAILPVSVGRISLAALLLLSAAWYSVAAQKSPSERWEKDIRKFEAADKASPPPQGGVLFIGSSSIRMWVTLARDFPEHKVINRGFGGSQIADSVYYAERIVFPYKPRLIVMRAGGNDIAAGKTPDQVAADFRAFVEKVRAKLPETRICYMSLAPTRRVGPTWRKNGS